MAKKSILPQSRHHILLYDEDWNYLMRRFGPGSANAGVGVSGAIKHVIHQRVLGLKALEAGELDKLRAIQAGEASGNIPEDG